MGAMLRNLKILLATAALLAFGAVVCSPAQALFTYGETTKKITSAADGAGEAANHVIKVAGGSLICSGMSSLGTPGSTGKFQMEGLKYSGCTFLGVATSVATGTCDRYVVFQSGKFSFNGVCTEPIRWEVKVAGGSCKVEMGRQIELSEVKYSTIESGGFKEITMAMNLSKIAYTATGSGCPKAGAFVDGTYTANVIFTGADSEGKMTSIWWE